MPSSVQVERVPAIVIGAGILGCTVSRVLAERGLAPWVLEQGPRIAEGVTSRNSGVIHAGIYYRPGSLKADTCIRGAALLYEWCERKSVPYRRCGKWIVGTTSEEAELDALLKNARDSGVSGLKKVGEGELRERLPHVDANLAIWSPNTGIVDPYEFAKSHQIEAENSDAIFLFNCQVTGIERIAQGYRVTTSRGIIESDLLINASGLQADEIARLAGISKYRIHPCRGDYFRLSSRYVASTLIYPVKKKSSPGLGIHLTVSLDGLCKLGPDAEYVSDREDFSSREDKREVFFRAASRYLKDLRLEDLSYDSCGIRPKLRGPQDPEELDFIVSQDLPGMINLIGIESPGLTASMALAEKVATLVFDTRF